MKDNVKKDDIQILVVNHKPSFVPENDLLKPIQVGTSLADKKLDGMAYYDDTGDNISDKNRSYCELTAIYWAWKNLDADYYGLFHYRRYLNFSSDQDNNLHPGRAYSHPSIATATLDLNESTMRKIIEGNDMIVPRKDEAHLTTKDGKLSIYSQYEHEHFIKDLDYCLKYIKDKYPKIAVYLDALNGRQAYFCNMFIMKKRVFNEYAEFIFDVLGSFDKNVDISKYNSQQYRAIGFLAEHLTNIFIQYVIGQNKYKVKELQMVYFENTDPIAEVKPIDNTEKEVAIVLAADDFYVPYVSTLIGSLAEHANKDRIYDINIFHRNITPRNQSLLINEFKNINNISIRFCDMSHRVEEYGNLATMLHITVETYFRLFIQDIMKDYKKVLYLDGDMIVKHDVADLYDQNVRGYILGAVRDIDMAGVYNSNLVKAEDNIDPKRKEYIDNVIGLTNPYDYFQAGVLLLNLDMMRKSFTVKDAIKLASEREWTYLDQDILNYLAKGKVKYLDQKWNVLYDWEFVRIKNVISKAPVEMFDLYMESRKDPSIIHYGGTVKPWSRPDCDFGEEYWAIARKSVFYETIIGRMAEWRVHNGLKTGLFNKMKLRSRITNIMRGTVDKLAPVGTYRRKSITSASRLLKKVIR